jgi:hypothetical protein
MNKESKWVNWQGVDDCPDCGGTLEVLSAGDGLVVYDGELIRCINLECKRNISNLGYVSIYDDEDCSVIWEDD